MKKLLVMLVGLLILVLPVLAQEDDPAPLGVQGILTSGSSLEGRFTEEQGMLLYAFSAQEGDPITLTMSAQSGDVDPFLVLLNERGELVASDDDSAGNLNALLNVSAPQDGLYLVLASSFRSLYLPESEAGDFSLLLEGGATDAEAVEELLLNPSLPELSLDGSLTVELSEEMPVFLAYVTVRDSVNLALNAESNAVDTLLYVFDSEGQRLGLDDDSGSVGNSAYLPSLRMDEAGKYLIVATQHDFLAPTSYGAFTLSSQRP